MYTALTQRTDKKRFVELQGTSATPLARISALSSASARRCSRQSEPRSETRAIGARHDRFEARVTGGGCRAAITPQCPSVRSRARPIMSAPPATPLGEALEKSIWELHQLEKIIEVGAPSDEGDRED